MKIKHTTVAAVIGLSVASGAAQADIFNDIGNFVSSGGNAIKGVAEDAIDVVKDSGQDLYEDVSGTYKTVAGKFGLPEEPVKEVIGDLENVAKKITNHPPSLSLLRDLEKSYNNNAAMISSAVNKGITAVTAGADGAYYFFNSELFSKFHSGLPYPTARAMPLKSKIYVQDFDLQDGNALAMLVNSYGTVHYYAPDGTLPRLKSQPPGKVTDIAIAGSIAWVVNEYGDMYRGFIATLVTGHTQWERVSGKASKIFIGAPYDSQGNRDVWHLTLDVKGGGGHHMYRHKRVNEGGHTWKNVPGEATEMAFGRNGEIWHSNAVGKMYKARWNGGSLGKWSQVQGVASHIVSSADGDVWHLSKAKDGNGLHNTYKWSGSGWSKSAAKGRTILPTRSDVPTFKDYMWTVDQNGFLAVSRHGL